MSYSYTCAQYYVITLLMYSHSCLLDIVLFFNTSTGSPGDGFGFLCPNIRSSSKVSKPFMSSSNRYKIHQIYHDIIHC